MKLEKFYLLSSIIEGFSHNPDTEVMTEKDFERWKGIKLRELSKDDKQAIKVYKEAWSEFNNHKLKVEEAGLIGVHPRDYPEKYAALRNWPEVPVMVEPKPKIRLKSYTDYSVFEEERFSKIYTNEDLVVQGHVEATLIPKTLYEDFKKYGLKRSSSNIFTLAEVLLWPR